MNVIWFVLILLLVTGIPLSWCDLPTVNDRIYMNVNVSSPCFRLTNATHQIGCSGSFYDTRGVLHYVDSNTSLTWVLNSGPYPPYLVLLEPELFTEHIILLLQSSSQVNGILLRYENNKTKDPDVPFSPERSCPNEGFGDGQDCEEPWNPYANNLLFHDFGDFPILALDRDQFQTMLSCYSKHNSNSTGSYSDYPLCSAEVTADMFAVVDTPTCKRRETLPVNYLSGVTICQNLADYNVWGTLFELPQELTNGVVMISTKMDSVSFFPAGYSFGAKSEVAGIVVLLAIIEQIGRLQKSGELTGTDHPILYSFFHGESWDYIGSSRMIYDMENDKFPKPIDHNLLQLPLLHVSNISKYIELSQLGLPQPDTDTPNLYLHGTANQSTSLTDTLKEHLSLSNFSLVNSSRTSELPPASLQRFIKAGVKNNRDFEGYVLTAFDQEFNNKFFGSRYDDEANLVGNSTLESVAEKLEGIATALAQTVLRTSGPDCNGCVNNTSADVTIIEELLNCFLVNSNCSLFRSVTDKPDSILHPRPLSRYITVGTQNNTETLIVFKLAALFSAYNDTILPCSDCMSMVNNSDQVTNRTSTPYNSSFCHCLESYTYMHEALSPAFEKDKEQYGSTEYSTWAESRWDSVSLRMYLVVHSAEEVGVLIGGIGMTVLCALVVIQCRRRSDLIFQPPDFRDTYHVS